MGCDFTQPYDHSAPVYHGFNLRLLHEWPDECMWAQLQYERWQRDRDSSNYTSIEFLANLEAEWDRRGICSRCHREIGPSVGEQMAELEERVRNAEDKLGRIRKAVVEKPDIILGPEVRKILDEP